MQQEPTTEQRLLIVEQKIRELEQNAKSQSDINMGLLLRTDLILGKVQDVAREQSQGFQALMAGQKELEAGQKASEAKIDTIVEALKDHKIAIETIAQKQEDHKTAIESLAGQVGALAAGQQQILELLIGKPPRND